MFRGERINVTEDRAVLHTALRAPAGRAPRGRWRGRRSRRSMPCSSAWPYSPTASVPVTGPGTPVDPSRPSSTSASVAPTWGRSWPTRRCVPTRSETSRSASCPTSTAPTSPKPCATSTLPRRSSSSPPRPSPRSRRCATHARRGPGCWRRSATKLPSPGTSWPSPPTLPRSPRSASTPTTCSGSGTGSAAATRWSRPSVSPP